MPESFQCGNGVFQSRRAWFWETLVSTLGRLYYWVEQVVWPELLERGWREEKVRCKSTYSLWMPPNVFRGTKDFKARVDYFDTAPQVRCHALLLVFGGARGGERLIGEVFSSPLGVLVQLSTPNTLMRVT